jgi:hypothetical protein
MKIDRRIIYLVAVSLVVLTVFVPIGLPVSISPASEAAYDTIQGLHDGALVLIAPMYDPGAAGELNPMLMATLRQCAERGYYIVLGNCSWTSGPQMVHPMVTDILAEYNYVYGEQYIEFGSKPGGSVWMQSAVTDFVAATLTDYDNNPLSQFAITAKIPKLTAEFVDMVIVMDCGTPGYKEWIAYVCQPGNIPLVVGEIQMSVPELMPYLDAGQVQAMIAGSRGCAEYEQLIGHPGKALKSQDTMSVIALMITLFVLLGNIGYLTRKK